MSDYRVSYVSPTTGLPVVQVLTEAQAKQFWDRASQPIRETSTFTHLHPASAGYQMTERTKEELQALLTKITGVEGQSERAEAIRAKIAEMEADEKTIVDSDPK